MTTKGRKAIAMAIKRRWRLWRQGKGPRPGVSASKAIPFVTNGNGSFKDSVKAEIDKTRAEIDRLGKYVLSLEMLETR